MRIAPSVYERTTGNTSELVNSLRFVFSRLNQSQVYTRYMSVESLFDQYYERAVLPIRNTEFAHTQLGSLDIRQVIEDDEFRNLNHKIVLKNSEAFVVWRDQEWGFGENSLDVTHFSDGIVQSLSLRHAGDSVTGLKLSMTRSDWLVPDPDFRLPYIFERSDMETWYKASNFKMELARVRLAWDKETKHTFTVKDAGIDKNKAEHLYRDVEYRIEIDDGIRLTIDGKSPRRVNWKTEFTREQIVALYEYASTEQWMDGWGPVTDIIEQAN